MKLTKQSEGSEEMVRKVSIRLDNIEVVLVEAGIDFYDRSVDNPRPDISLTWQQYDKLIKAIGQVRNLVEKQVEGNSEDESILSKV